jgi:hypothetical protein
MKKIVTVTVAMLTACGFSAAWGDAPTFRVSRDMKAVTEKTSLSQTERADHPHGWGYLFAAPGAVVSGDDAVGTGHIGGGFEGVLYKGLGVGAEVGYLAAMEAFGEGVGVFSINGAYHFEGSSEVTPFVTFGYSRAFRGESIKLWNVGIGMNFWSAKNSALRVELRDHFMLDEGALHFLGLRLGLSFR